MDQQTEVSEVGRKTVVSVMWSAAGKASATITSLVVFIVLARLLTPVEFGTFATALVFVEVTKIFANAGWMDAIVRERDLDDAFLSTAFWSNLVLATIVAVVVALGAIPYGIFLKQPEVTPLLWSLAPLVPLSCLTTVHIGKVLHNFGYRALATRTFIVNLLAGSAAVAAAFAGWGVWSLFVQALVADIGNVIVAWLLSPWVPKWSFSLTRLKALAKFTTAMVGAQLTWFLIARIPDLFIARSLGAASLGTYRIGFRTFELIGQLGVQPVATVSLTTFSRLSHDPVLLERAYVRILSLLSMALFPLMGGFAVVAPDIIPLVFGPNWTSSVPIAQILMLLMVPYLMSYFDSAILGAVGQSGALMKIAISQLILTTLGAALAAPYGVNWVAGVYVVQAYITLIYQQMTIQSKAGCNFLTVLRGIAPALFATFTMVAVTGACRLMLISMEFGPLLRVLFTVAIGMASYLVFLPLFARRAVSTVRLLLQEYFRKQL